MGITTLADGSRYNTDEQNRPLFQYADEVGDGSGNNNAIGTYDGNDTDFLIQPAPGEVIHIIRMMVSLEDAGSFDSGGYGNGSALSNGISVIEFKDGVERTDLTGGVPIKTNGQWAAKCHDLNLFTFGSGNQWQTLRWTFAKSGTDIRLDGNAATPDKLVVRLRDDMDHLVSQRFFFQGFYESTVE